MIFRSAGETPALRMSMRKRAAHRRRDTAGRSFHPRGSALGPVANSSGAIFSYAGKDARLESRAPSSSLLRFDPLGAQHRGLALVGRNLGDLATRQPQADLHRHLDVARLAVLDLDLAVGVV